MNYDHLGANVRYFRGLHRCTQRTLAERAGPQFSQAYISQIEHGVRPSDPDQLAALATALEVPVESLLKRPRFVNRAEDITRLVVLRTELAVGRLQRRGDVDERRPPDDLHTGTARNSSERSEEFCAKRTLAGFASEFAGQVDADEGKTI